MKIFIISSWGKTAFEVGQYCRQAFLTLGQHADSFTYNDCRLSKRIPYFKKAEQAFTERTLLKRISDFNPDLVLVVKGDSIPEGVITGLREKYKIPVANYWLDDPFSIELSKSISPLYDYFFTNDPNSVAVHMQAGCRKVGFLTFGCSPLLHRKVKLSSSDSVEYGSEICFAGTVCDARLKMLEALSSFNLKIWSDRIVYCARNGKMDQKKLSPSSVLYNKFTGRSVWGEELVKVYNASKIVINIHSPQPVPIMRDYEVTGCGAFLLTDYANGMENIFELGKELVCFGNATELKDNAIYYLSNQDKIQEIAKRGQQRAYRDHTYAIRMRELLKFIQDSSI